MAIDQKQLARMGRPPSLTPELGEDIAALVEKGASIQSAAMSMGVGDSTVREWLSRGRGKHDRGTTPLYTWFATAIDRAWARREANLVETVYNVSQYAERDSDRLAASKFLLTHGPHRDYWKPAASEVEGEIDHNIILKMPTSLQEMEMDYIDVDYSELEGDDDDDHGDHDEVKALPETITIEIPDG